MNAAKIAEAIRMALSTKTLPEAVADELRAALVETERDATTPCSAPIVAKTHDGAPVPPQMRGVARQKLDGLLAEGWELDGFGIRRPSGDTMRHGLVTTGGRVLWWHGETEQLAEPSEFIITTFHTNPNRSGFDNSPDIGVRVIHRATGLEESESRWHTLHANNYEAMGRLKKRLAELGGGVADAGANADADENRMTAPDGTKLVAEEYPDCDVCYMRRWGSREMRNKHGGKDCHEHGPPCSAGERNDDREITWIVAGVGEA